MCKRCQLDPALCFIKKMPACIDAEWARDFARPVILEKVNVCHTMERARSGPGDVWLVLLQIPAFASRLLMDGSPRASAVHRRRSPDGNR